MDAGIALSCLTRGDLDTVAAAPAHDDDGQEPTLAPDQDEA
ncbi:hypothetical protein ACQEUU_33920 [Nonomuraea sp. CA-218870]|uniref:Uncharacterized protein n=1 Tax=Nonomuraea corallina TaxID=2989783 RepID=A0ABT4SBN3_9ACTN|nr:hypothetical protein [Nonomuraea corallina]MDA0634365.1 hypothetical protein [Nonomuraea corallina]